MLKRENQNYFILLKIKHVFQYRFIFLLIINLAFSSKSQSQKAIHNFGLGFFLAKENATNNTSPIFHFTYFPQINLLEYKKTSISIGSPLSLGFMFNNDEDEYVANFALDIPIALDFNFGNKISNEAINKLGGYFGIGFGFSHISVNHERDFGFTNGSFGFIYRAGIRIRQDNSHYNIKYTTLAFFIKNSTENYNHSLYGISYLARF